VVHAIHRLTAAQGEAVGAGDVERLRALQAERDAHLRRLQGHRPWSAAAIRLWREVVAMDRAQEAALLASRAALQAELARLEQGRRAVAAYGSPLAGAPQVFLGAS
jgi:hypothetical protein